MLDMFEIKSPFEDIVPEDFAQFRDASARFQQMDLTDIKNMQKLAIYFLLLATRWSEIQSCSVKIANEFGISKTDFSTWAYQKYRQLQEMHVSCRSWSRQGKDEYEANCMTEGQI